MINSDKCFEDARKILADTSTLLDKIMYSMGDGLSIQDRNMRIIYQNQFMIDQFGSHMGEYCYAIYERRDTVCDGCPIVEAFCTGNVTKALRVGITRDGTPFRFENIASPLRNDQGEIVAGIELCRIVEDREKALDDLRAMTDHLQQTQKQLIHDIAERKRVENALQETKNRLVVVLSTIPDPIWLKDPDGVYLTCNPEFELLYGASESEILGKTDYDFVPRELADIFRRKDKEAIAAGRVSINEEEIEYRSDGRNVTLETRKVPVMDAKGNVLGVLGIGRDITDRKKAQEESEKRARLQGVLQTTGAVCHELNQPLQTILSLVEAARDDMEPEPATTLQQDLKDIKASVDKLAEITRKLNNITSYQTQDYVEGTQILDLDKSSGA